MPSYDLLLAFALTTAIFAFMPGPAVLYATARTVAGGRSGYVHIASAAAGLSVLFHAVPALYVAVKLAGAAYLVWLGFSMFRAKTEAGGDVPVVAQRSGRKAFLESIAVEVLNPKTALFFLAFLPQFVDAGASLPLWAQLAILGTAVGVMFTIADIVYVLLAAMVMERLKQSSHVEAWLRRIGGSILMGLGAHMALQRS
jgi:threonine/homoserine/homoserine lactone efflux protein